MYSSPMEPWAGPPQTVVCDEFSNLAKGYGYRIEAAPAHPGLLAVGVPWSTARQHRREMQQAEIRRALHRAYQGFEYGPRTNHSKW